MSSLHLTDPSAHTWSRGQPITDMTETWLKPNDYIGLNESTTITVISATVISMSLVRLVVAAVLQQYIVIFSMLLRKLDTGLTHSKYLCFMLHCQIS